MGSSLSVQSAALVLEFEDDDGTTRTINESVPPDIRVVQLAGRGFSGVTGMTSLVEVIQINMSHNRLASLPDMWGLELRELQLSSNRLASISPRIGTLTALGILHLSRNNLKVLPDEIGDCTSLRWLNVANNPLETIPRTVERLATLDLLNMEACALRYLPLETANLPPACEIFLFANQRLEIKVRRTGEPCRRRLDELFSQTEHLDMIREHATTLCVGLADLDLPALVALEIVDAAFPNAIPMHRKWDLIVAVKHWHKRHGVER